MMTIHSIQVAESEDEKELFRIRSHGLSRASSCKDVD